MKFSFEHHLHTEPDQVVEALTDQRFWELLAQEQLPAQPELVDITTVENGVLTIVNFTLVDDLPREAARFIDPSSVKWVQETLWKPSSREAELRFIPNQAKQLLHATAKISLVADLKGTRRDIQGELRIRIPLLGSKIEPTLVNHIETYVNHEARVLERFLHVDHP